MRKKAGMPRKIFRPGIILAPVLLAALGNILFAQPGAGPEADAFARPARLVIIDDDVGMLRKEVLKQGIYQAPWFKFTDPDGGLELIYALREPRIKILGITCTMGCSTTDVCMKSVKKILDLTGRTDVPLFRGADTPSQLGQPTEAAKFIIDTVMSHPGEVEIIATAPLTNIATALMLEPRLARNWKMLHLATGEFMGRLGELSDGARFSKTGLYQDLNISVDPEAIRYVLERGENFIVYPNEVMDDAVLTGADRKALNQAGTPLSKWVASEVWHMVLAGKVTGLEGMGLHGVIPVAIAIDPSLAEPAMEIRISLDYLKPSGNYFAVSNDPKIPARPVYARLRDPVTIEKQMLERCQ